MNDIKKDLLKKLKHIVAQISIYYDTYNTKDLIRYNNEALELLNKIITEDNIDLNIEENNVFNNLKLVLNWIKKYELKINKKTNNFNWIDNIKDIYDIENFILKQFVKLLKKWNVKFEDYLDIKYDELDNYMLNNLQEYWFAIDSDIEDYKDILKLKEKNENELVEFLDDLFFNWKDYMNEEIATTIQRNIDYYKKGELDKIDLNYTSKI